jgi:hypothetical protein
MQSGAPSAVPPPPQGGLQAAIQQQAAELKAARVVTNGSAPQHASPHAQAVNKGKGQSAAPAPPPLPPQGWPPAAKRKPARAAPGQEAASRQVCAQDKVHFAQMLLDS